MGSEKSFYAAQSETVSSDDLARVIDPRGLSKYGVGVSNAREVAIPVKKKTKSITPNSIESYDVAVVAYPESRRGIRSGEINPPESAVSVAEKAMTVAAGILAIPKRFLGHC